MVLTYYCSPVWAVHGVIRIKGIVHPKVKLMSSFTHPQEVPNLYEYLCSAEHKGRYFEECGERAVLGHH